MSSAPFLRVLTTLLNHTGRNPLVISHNPKKGVILSCSGVGDGRVFLKVSFMSSGELPPLEPSAIRYDDQPVIPKRANALQSTSTRLIDLFKGNVYPIACVLSLVWGYRSLKSMNMVLAINYSDIIYQIRRPDVIANRISAFKYLVVGGTFVPCVIGGFYYGIKHYTSKSDTEMGIAVSEGVRVIPVTSSATQEAVKRLTGRLSNAMESLAPNSENNAVIAMTTLVSGIGKLVQDAGKPGFASRTPEVTPRDR